MPHSPYHAGLRDDLLIGRQEFRSLFCSSLHRTLKAGELLTAAGRSDDVIYRLCSGWACQFRDLRDGRRAIIDVYLPGDVIGLDAALHIRPVEEVLTLTSITVEVMHVENGLRNLLSRSATALYIASLLCQRQRRTDRLLAAMSCHDARGRLAMMLLDFYKRLRARRLITSTSYSLPLTQNQIGDYLGLTVIHVNRVLRLLREELIVTLEKHFVTILKIEKLTQLAESGRTMSAASAVGSPALDQATLH